MVGSEIEERSEDNVQSQAGRTLDTFSSKTESPTLAQTPPNTTVDNTFKDPDKPFISVESLHNQKKDSDNHESVQFEDSPFSKPLQQFNKEATHVAQVSNLRSEYSNKFEPSPVVTETKSNGASVKKIFGELEKKHPDDFEKKFSPELENSIIDALIEENYMPMSPKKNILAPRSSISSDTATLQNDLETEENHYVEMTQNTISSILLDSKENKFANGHQPYEMVCFSGGKIEPVYMELKNPELLSDSKTQELPDILMASKKTENHSNKSDSSDADDEASKDLDSLDTPSQPRFSLSDNFRPASYYLGASRAGPDLHDSSDSELVSPPPIPAYPPPSLNISATDEYAFSLSKISHREDIKKMEDPRMSDQFYNSTTENVNTNNYSINEIDKGISSKRFLGEETDKDKKKRNQETHNIDSEGNIRFNSPVNYNSSVMMLKRKPVSDEFCNELALGHTFRDDFHQSNDLERYINDLSSCSGSITGDIDKNLDARVATVKTISTNRPNYEYENVVMRAFPNDMELSQFSDISAAVEDENIAKQLNTTHIFSVQTGSSGTLTANSSLTANSTLTGNSTLTQNSIHSNPTVDMDFLIDSNRDISIAMFVAEQRDQSFSPVPAPYYYSDLSVSCIDKNNAVLTLNNQRESNNGGKRDITHIINPIKCNSLTQNSTTDSLEDTYKLAAEARSASVDFLNLTDKSGNIDEKNIYESNSLKWQKTTRTDISLPIDPTTRNLYPSRYCDKFRPGDGVPTDTVRRSYSLEGLLGNISTQVQDACDTGDEQETNRETYSTNFEGSYIWEEDSIWRERLRSASQRHTKSMEDLETIGNDSRRKKQPRGITRDVTYVNDNYFKHDKTTKEDGNETNNFKSYSDKKEGNFIIDREKLRQWDLLSSAPSDDQLSTITAIQAHEGSNIVVQIGEGNCDSPDIDESQETGIYFIYYRKHVNYCK